MFNKQGKGSFDIFKYLLFVIATFALIAVISIILEYVVPDQTFFTEPSVPLLFLVVLGASALPYAIFVSNGKLDSKDWWGLAISAVLIVVLLAFLPTKFPEIFGQDFVLSNFIKSLDLFKSSLGLP